MAEHKRVQDKIQKINKKIKEFGRVSQNLKSLCEIVG